jgi:ElaB/YqjD/DUF883 family membrane-anchored ribosome-binding protein
MSTESTFPTSDAMSGSSSPMSSTSPRLDGGPATTAASGEDLVRRVAQGAHQTIDRLADSALPAVGKLQSSVEGMGDKLHSGADQMREMGDEWTESMRTTVREHPVTSVLVALAAGMLIARLTAPSR